MSERTNVLIQQHPQGALFQHWWIQITGGCRWWDGHQVAVQVFSLQPPHLHPKRWCNPLQTIISHGTDRLFAPLHVDIPLISTDLLIPLLLLSSAPMWLSCIHRKPHSVSLMKSKSELILQRGYVTSSPSWPHIHRHRSLMDFKYGCDLNSNKKQFSQH